MDAPGFNGLGFSEKSTILVVDDAPGNLDLMSNLLKNDYKVKVASSGEKALKIATSDLPPDLILQEDEKKGLELGAIDYITKPICTPIVMARVRNHLALKAIADFLRDQNDWDSAGRLAYTLRGVSGNVGVAGLQQFVEKLEVAVNMRRSLEGGRCSSRRAVNAIQQSFRATGAESAEGTVPVVHHS